MTKYIHILGGGTVSHIRNHLALSTPAYGTASFIESNFDLSQSTDELQR